MRYGRRSSFTEWKLAWLGLYECSMNSSTAPIVFREARQVAGRFNRQASLVPFRINGMRSGPARNTTPLGKSLHWAALGGDGLDGESQ